MDEFLPIIIYLTWNLWKYLGHNSWKYLGHNRNYSNSYGRGNWGELCFIKVTKNLGVNIVIHLLNV